MTPQSPQPTLPSGDLDLPHIKSRQKLTGAAREAFSKKVVAAYQTPHRKVTIREICAKTNRSYGAIHSILSAAGATKRGRWPADPSKLGAP
ncbi:helix-turn-helix domain-containing protein [Streptomyces lydicus]|uniref:helix-turn-helix domain-containing protein n=1 Tax=Streptomyces lydicus TaxID=47763 RepID=UPI0037A2C93B